MNQWKKHSIQWLDLEMVWEKSILEFDTGNLITNNTKKRAFDELSRLVRWYKGGHCLPSSAQLSVGNAELAYFGIYVKPRRFTGQLLLHSFGYKEAHFSFSLFRS